MSEAVRLRPFSARFALIALIGALLITRIGVGAPAYTDAFYHYNAALRLASGAGLTEPYLWTYLGAPDRLPEIEVFPSHLYWMPMTSLVASTGLTLSRGLGDTIQPYADFDSYPAAQLPFSLMFAGTICLAYALGALLGGQARHAWASGLLMLFSGFYSRFWGTIDTFAPFALFGAGCILVFGLMARRAVAGEPVPWAWALVGGALAGLGHLTRADGLLLPAVGLFALVLGARALGVRRLAGLSLLVLVGYAFVMAGWWARNMIAIGTPLPVGGVQAVWYTDYNDIFTYPPAVTPAHLLDGGLGAVFASRQEAVSNNAGTFIVVEGLIVNMPLMLIGLWQLRRDPLTQVFSVYALLVHVAMTLVFPFPGFRGGLLHSAAALMPFWSAYGLIGLDATVKWAARRRRWNPGNARRFFTGALVIYAAALSVWLLGRGYVPPLTAVPDLYQQLLAALPGDARVMINDPAQLYFFTGLGGVVLPNAPAERLPDLAQRYAITHILIERTGQVVQAPDMLVRSLEPLPDFLSPLPLMNDTVRLYAIHPAALPASP